MRALDQVRAGTVWSNARSAWNLIDRVTGLVENPQPSPLLAIDVGRNKKCSCRPFSFETRPVIKTVQTDASMLYGQALAVPGLSRIGRNIVARVGLTHEARSIEILEPGSEMCEGLGTSR